MKLSTVPASEAESSEDDDDDMRLRLSMTVLVENSSSTNMPVAAVAPDLRVFVISPAIAGQVHIYRLETESIAIPRHARPWPPGLAFGGQSTVIWRPPGKNK